MRKRIIAAMLAISMPIVLASAQTEIKTDTEKGEIIITGKTDIIENGEPVLVTVAKKGYNFADVNADKKGILYFGEAELDKDGNYLITVPVDNETVDCGEYNIWLSGDNISQDEPVYEVKYYTNAFFQSIIDGINYEKTGTAPTLEEVKALFGEYADELGITPHKIYDSVDKEKVMQRVTDIISLSNEHVQTASGFKSFVHTVSFVEAFNQNMAALALDADGNFIIDIKGYDEQSGMNCNELYTTGMTDDGRKGVISDITGKNFATIEEWYDALMDSCFLNAVKYPVKFGYAHLTSLLTEPKVDVDVTDYNSLETDNEKEDVCRQMMEFTDEYTDIQKFSEKLAQISKAAKNPDGEGEEDDDSETGSSSDSSRGTSGSKNNYTVIVPPEVSKPVETQKPQISFNDLDTVPWAEEAIKALAREGIVNGVGDEKFAPDEKVKREEFVKMLVEATGIQLTAGASGFTDSDINAWFEKYLYTAKKSGIISGYADGSFGVGRNITRQECAAMLYRAVKNMGILKEKRKISFTDEDSFAQYAYDAIYALAGAEIINGKGNGEFMPEALCTRAEAAVMIYGIIKQEV